MVQKKVHPPKPLGLILNIIDAISIWTGKAFAWMIFPMAGSLVFEVISRYFFNRPTIWAGDISFMLYGSFFMLGSAYALQRQQHIRTDFMYRNWSKRKQGAVDALLYLLLYFPGMGMFLWVGWNFAHKSWILKERIVSSPWMPIVYPLKMAIPLATALLLLQGISEFLKSGYAAVTGVSLYEEAQDVET